MLNSPLTPVLNAYKLDVLFRNINGNKAAEIGKGYFRVLINVQCCSKSIENNRLENSSNL